MKQELDDKVFKRFAKNDNGFTCIKCGAKVSPLGNTSRDHCNMCLHALHVDINPGDRANNCQGLLIPVSIRPDSKKGYIINYLCKKCGKKVNNKSAPDDSFEEILSICKNQK